MSIFTDILKALGIGKAKADAPTAGVTKRPPVQGTPGMPFKQREMPMVDVVSKMDALAKANPQKLEWKVSIVDLLKLLGIDSSYENRKALAIELGCPPDLMSDSARMNIWLHKTVLKKISENGGNVPASLLD